MEWGQWTVLSDEAPNVEQNLVYGVVQTLTGQTWTAVVNCSEDGVEKAVVR